VAVACGGGCVWWRLRVVVGTASGGGITCGSGGGGGVAVAGVAFRVGSWSWSLVGRCCMWWWWPAMGVGMVGGIACGGGDGGWVVVGWEGGGCRRAQPPVPVETGAGSPWLRAVVVAS
jgi:hypothetical protein